MKLEVARSRMKWNYMIVIGLSDILNGLIIILTLGRYASNLSLKLALWYTQKDK